MDLLASGWLQRFLGILTKLKKGPVQRLDEKNHGDWFLMTSHRFKIWGREKNMTTVFFHDGHCSSLWQESGWRFGERDRELVLPGTSSEFCFPWENLTLAEGEWQHQERELITKYLLISSRANRNCFTWPPSMPPYLHTRPHCPQGRVQSHSWSTEHGTWQIMAPNKCPFSTWLPSTFYSKEIAGPQAPW